MNELFIELSLENPLYLEDSGINEIRAKYNLELYETPSFHKKEVFIEGEPNLEPETDSYFGADNNDDYSDGEEPKVDIKEVIIKSEPIFNMEYELETAIQDNLFNQFPPDVKTESEVKKSKKKKKVLPRRKATKKLVERKIDEYLGASDDDPEDKDYVASEEEDEVVKPKKKEKQEKAKKPTIKKEAKAKEKLLRENVIKMEEKVIP